MKNNTTIIILLLMSTNCYAGVNLAMSNIDGEIKLPEIRTVREAEIVGQMAAGNRQMYDKLRRAAEKSKTSKMKAPKLKSRRQATKYGIDHYGNKAVMDMLQELWRESRKHADNGDYAAREESDNYLEAIRTMEDPDMRPTKTSSMTVPKFKSIRHATLWGIKHHNDEAMLTALRERMAMIRVDVNQAEQAEFLREAIITIQDPIVADQMDTWDKDRRFERNTLLARAWQVAQDRVNQVGADIVSYSRPVNNRGIFWGGVYLP